MTITQEAVKAALIEAGLTSSDGTWAQGGTDKIAQLVAALAEPPAQEPQDDFSKARAYYRRLFGSIAAPAQDADVESLTSLLYARGVYMTMDACRGLAFDIAALRSKQAPTVAVDDEDVLNAILECAKHEHHDYSWHQQRLRILDIVNRALRTRAEQREEPGDAVGECWHDISTAPKGERVQVCWYLGSGYWAMQFAILSVWDGQWRDTLIGKILQGTPTAWMPAPAAPEKGER